MSHVWLVHFEISEPCSINLIVISSNSIGNTVNKVYIYREIFATGIFQLCTPGLIACPPKRIQYISELNIGDIHGEQFFSCVPHYNCHVSIIWFSKQEPGWIYCRPQCNFLDTTFNTLAHLPFFNVHSTRPASSTRESRQASDPVFKTRASPSSRRNISKKTMALKGKTTNAQCG